MNHYIRLPRDPGYGALRRAARAAIVIPLLFAFADLELGDPQSLIFVVFGGFSLLVISDFGGQRPARAIAYLTATLVGAGLVALGTLASSSTWLAVSVMFLVGLVISFAKVFGSYIAAANTGMLLAFVIAVTIPGPAMVIPDRVGSWTIAGLVSTLAAVLLWPRFERVTMQNRAAEGLLAVADLVDGMWSAAGRRDVTSLKQTARQSVQAARQGYVAMSKRPTATVRRDRSFVQLLIQLETISNIIEEPFNAGHPEVRPGLDEASRLLDVVVAALRSSAAVLTRSGPPPDVHAIEVAREQHRSALDRWADEQLRAGRPPEEVLDGLDNDDTLRAVSYLTLLLGGNATIAAGTRPDPRDTARHILRTIRAHLESPSTVLQGSLRVGIGLALAVWVGRAFDLQHSFWVVLGTVQVLRTNVLGTGVSVVQAILGNTIGVLVGGLFVLLAGNHPAVMWTALPIAVFLAAYAVTTIGFMASQAAFTITLVTLFNLITPAGWQIGLVRIEDLLIGALISVVVGLLLWPRGVRQDLARALSGLYRRLASYLDHAFDGVLGFEAATALDPDRQVIIRARDRVDVALDTFRTEGASGPLDWGTATFFVSSANHALLAGDLLDVVSGAMGYRAGSCADGASGVQEQVRILVAGYNRLADRLSLSRNAERESQMSYAAVRDAGLKCMRLWQTDPGIGKGAMAVVIAGEWAQDLARVEADLEAAVGPAVEAARRPWWR